MPLMSRSLPMNGKAMLAMVASSTTISWAMVISTRARPRRGPVVDSSAMASSGPSPTTTLSDIDVSSVLSGRVFQSRGQDDLVDHVADGVPIGREPHQEESVQADACEGGGEEVEVDAVAQLAARLGLLED